MSLRLKPAVKLAVALGLLVACRTSSAGLLGEIGLLTTTSYPSTSSNGACTVATNSTSNVGTWATASMSASATGVANTSGPAIASGGAGIYVTSSYRVYWKEDYIGQTAPTTIYHHHQITTTAYAARTLYSGSYKILSATSTAGVSGASVGPTNTSSDSDITFTTGSFSPGSWIYFSTDGAGFKTFYADSPTITTGSASGVLQITLTQSGSSASATFDSELTDDLYFSLSSTPSW